SHGGGNAGPRPRPAGTVFPGALKSFWFRHRHQQDGLTRTERTGSPFAGSCRAKIWVMGPAEGSDAAIGRVAHPGAGVVSRPDLARRLGASARVTVVSAPPGSGKSVLLRSWIGEAGLMDSAGWVSVGRDHRDPQRLWLSVLGALRQTSAGSRLVRELTAAPDLDGWAVVERL